MEEKVPMTCPEQVTTRPEAYNLTKLLSYLSDCPAKAVKVSILLKYLDDALKPKRGRGKVGNADKTQLKMLSKDAEKLKHSEATTYKFADELKALRDTGSASSKRRRVGRKLSEPLSQPITSYS